MNINPDYGNEYTVALKLATEATEKLNSYLTQLDHDPKRSHFLAQEERKLLEEERRALDRYRLASHNYFGE